MKIALSKRTISKNGGIYDAIETAWYEYLKGHELVFVPNRLDQDFDALLILSMDISLQVATTGL